MRIQHLVRRLLIGLLLALVTLTATAFDRRFPPNTKRGVMAPADYPTVIIDGQLRRLSVAIQIRGADNLIKLPASLPAYQYLVNYTEDNQGNIHRIWILTNQEASQPLPAQ